MGHFGLTDIEYELMVFVWKNEKPVTFAEILRFCNEEKGRNWAKTTAHTYVTRLMQKGLLGVSCAGAKRAYYALISREELAHKSAEEFVNTSFSGSLKAFLVSFTCNHPLSSEEAEELYRLLDDISEQKTKE